MLFGRDIVGDDLKRVERDVFGGNGGVSVQRAVVSFIAIKRAFRKVSVDSENLRVLYMTEQG